MHRMITLQDAVRHLYKTAVVEGAKTSRQRLRRLAEYCVQELDRRGLSKAERDIEIPGGGRPKEWDVAWQWQQKYRLVISLKSILSNVSGTVPNRIDELIGEVANVQMYSPEIVVGYLMVFDVSKDEISGKHGMKWCELLEQRLGALAGRSAPLWGVGIIEAYSIIKVDFSKGAKLLTPEVDIQRMFDILVAEVRKRNPGI